MREQVKNVPATLNNRAVANIAKAANEGSNARFLKFKKTKFLCGDDQIPLGREYIADATDWRRGWMKFRDGEVADQRIGRIADGFKAPERDELGDLDQAQWETGSDGKPRDPWVLQDLLPLEDAETGERYIFVTSSFGGRIAGEALCKRWARNANKGLPTVKLATAEFTTKAYGAITRPDFPIVGWEKDAGMIEVNPPNDPDALNDSIPF